MNRLQQILDTKRQEVAKLLPRPNTSGPLPCNVTTSGASPPQSTKDPDGLGPDCRGEESVSLSRHYLELF
jgi:hypothetical protein